jgi:hypothetical protein
VTYVFSLEAIATCEQRGHAFAWVETWHGIGFDECSRCGVTGATRERSAGILPGATVDAPDHVADAGTMVAAAATVPTRRVSSGRMNRNAARDDQIRARVAAGESQRSIAQAFGMHQSRVTQILRGGRAPKARPQDTARNAEIRRRMASGEPVQSIATAFGISCARVYQIAPARSTGGD